MNPKHLDRGLDVIQLETAAGAAIKNFKGACGEYTVAPQKERGSGTVFFGRIFEWDAHWWLEVSKGS